MFQLLAAQLAAAAVQSTSTQGLGPGRGEWKVDKAENHGLSQAALDQAAQHTAEVAPERNCLLVVKDGVIIEEKYFGMNTSDSVYETDSLGKTSVAALFGVAVQQGLIDIDRPLAEYGVQPATSDGGSGPQFEEGHSWGTFWPNVTARTLLAQSSGYGEVPPGSAFTYDSDEYVQHLSYALSAVVPNRTGGALQWAREQYAVPLGIPEFFDYDAIDATQGGPTQIASAGGQMVTCREMARFGQLMLNKGKWLDAQGQPFQMAAPAFIKEMMSPAFPGVLDGYGFLTWLNTDMTKRTSHGAPRSGCCGPRWDDGNKHQPTCGSTAAGMRCGKCCVGKEGYNLSNPVPCEPTLPVIPERGRGRTVSDPCEVVVRSTIGDSFPDKDWHAAPSDLVFGMGGY